MLQMQNGGIRHLEKPDFPIPRLTGRAETRQAPLTPLPTGLVQRPPSVAGLERLHGAPGWFFVGSGRYAARTNVKFGA